jgi:hypothetical protein
MATIPSVNRSKDVSANPIVSSSLANSSAAGKFSIPRSKYLSINVLGRTGDSDFLCHAGFSVELEEVLP